MNRSYKSHLLGGKGDISFDRFNALLQKTSDLASLENCNNVKPTENTVASDCNDLGMHYFFLSLVAIRNQVKLNEKHYSSQSQLCCTGRLKTLALLFVGL